MAYKTLIFGTDDLYPKLKPLYDAEVERDNLEIVAVVDDINALGGDLEKFPDFDLAIISSKTDFETFGGSGFFAGTNHRRACFQSSSFGFSASAR